MLLSNMAANITANTQKHVGHISAHKSLYRGLLNCSSAPSSFFSTTLSKTLIAINILAYGRVVNGHRLRRLLLPTRFWKTICQDFLHPSGNLLCFRAGVSAYKLSPFYSSRGHACLATSAHFNLRVKNTRARFCTLVSCTGAHRRLTPILHHDVQPIDPGATSVASQK